MSIQNKKSIKVVDMFCGAGGTSTGLIEACEALGMEVELTAINHWDRAIATHEKNHPEHAHYCNGIDELDPKKMFPEGFDVLWASPECTHHSRARGGKPMKDQSRATAWCVVRWVEAGEPDRVFIENVPEFVEWGPLDENNRPIQERKGETFKAWVAALVSFGYKVEWKVLVCADHGDPTSRKRLFVQAVKEGQSDIAWPSPRFSEKGEDLPKWRSARDIIDFEYPSQSIYERKKPLVDNTMRRIFTGLFRHSFKDFIVPNFGEREGQAPRTHDADKPVPSVTSHGAGCLVQPYVIAIDQQSSLGVWDQDRPLTTVTTKQRHCVVQPKLEPYIVELVNNADSRSLDKPVRTSGAHHALTEPKLEPFILPQHSCGSPKDMDTPVPTVAAAGAIQLVIPELEKLDIEEHELEAFLISYYGSSHSHDVEGPLNTVTCKERFGLVQPILRIDGDYYKLDIHFRMLQPHELAAAQGFREDYEFCGNKTEVVKQIGNAVPRHTARALVIAGITGDENVGSYL